MDISDLHRKLIAAARADRPSERVPYAFERRILARVSAPALIDSAAEWARALWRAAAPCVGIMLLLGAWSLFTPPDTPSSTADLSLEFENTVLAAVDPSDSAW